MALVTIPEVQAVTQVQVTDDDIVQAQFVVDIIGDVDLDSAQAVGKLGTRDLSLLKRAVAYQAAWMQGQIAYHERTDVTRIAGSASNGGIDVRDELSLLLAPLARQCLSRVTWKRRSTMADPTRAARRLELYFPPVGVTISRDPADNPYQADNFMRDAGPYWGMPE